MQGVCTYIVGAAHRQHKGGCAEFV